MSRAAAGAVAAVALLAAGTGCQQPIGQPAAQHNQDDDALLSAAASEPSAAVGGYRSVRGFRDVPLPVRVRIPRIAVNSTLERLGRLPDGTIEVPHAWQQAGWYAGGPRPGQPGAAVLLGHVDSKTGPAVFLRVRELRRGDTIVIDRVNGSSVRFQVRDVRRYPKDRFPTDEVYYPTLQPVLRLITCGGSFDRTTGHYRSNVIAFAGLVP